MSTSLVRVVHQQLINRSILLDKIDKSQGNSEGYAHRLKLKVYLPYANPLDASVRGYTDLASTDEVLLSCDRGTIAGLRKAGHVSFSSVTSDQTAAPVLGQAINDNSGTVVLIGNGFTSVSPDVTYVKAIAPNGSTQTFTNAEINADQIIDLCTMANQEKAKYNGHAASATAHFHADTTNAPIATADATDLASCITLLNVIRAKYEAHRILVGVGAAQIHAAADATNAITAVIAFDLATAILLVNNIKAKFNPHLADATVAHRSADVTNGITLDWVYGEGNTQLTIQNVHFTIGTPVAGWKFQIQANSKKSDTVVST